jgi:hypothetical protein
MILLSLKFYLLPGNYGRGRRKVHTRIVFLIRIYVYLFAEKLTLYYANSRAGIISKVDPLPRHGPGTKAVSLINSTGLPKPIYITKTYENRIEPAPAIAGSYSL